MHDPTNERLNLQIKITKYKSWDKIEKPRNSSWNRPLIWDSNSFQQYVYLTLSATSNRIIVIGQPILHA